MKNNWSDKKIDLLSKWMNMCKHYLDFHRVEKETKEKNIRRLLMTNISLSVIAIIMNGIVFLNKISFIVGNIAAATLNAIIAGLYIYHHYESHESRLGIHNSAIKAYKRIYYKIHEELNLSAERRVDCDQFIRTILLQLLDYEDDFEQPILSIATISTSASLDKPDINSVECDDGVSINSLESGESIQNEEDKCLTNLTNAQQVRFGMFVRRASARQNAMDYQMRRLGQK